MTWTRRHFVRAGGTAGAAILAGVRPTVSGSATSQAGAGTATISTANGGAAPWRLELIERVIPSSGRSVPIVGIGTRNYRTEWAEGGLDVYRDTLRVFSELGGRVLDTAPSYGDSETLLGGMLAELGIRDEIFLATKVDREGEAEGVARMQRSFELLKTDHVELMQVHNLRDTETQLATLRAWKKEGRVGHIGVTTSSDRQYANMEGFLHPETVDFVQLDYSIDNRTAADTLLPLARERGIAVLINMPFGRGSTFSRVKDRELPAWASEFQAETWGQFFLKYVVSHPAVTAAIPGTTKPHHAEDNLGAATGDLPDEAMRKRMEVFFDGLPE